MENEQKTKRWRYGVNRWIIKGLMVLGFILTGIFPPLRPHIQLPAEELSQQPLFGNVYLIAINGCACDHNKGDFTRKNSDW